MNELVDAQVVGVRTTLSGSETDSDQAVLKGKLGLLRKRSADSAYLRSKAIEKRVIACTNELAIGHTTLCDKIDKAMSTIEHASRC